MGWSLKRSWTSEPPLVPPADWGEKLARAFVQRARAVHSGTAPEEGLSMWELLSLRSGRLHSTRSCKRLIKETPHPADLQAPEGPCHGDISRRPLKRKVVALVFSVPAICTPRFRAACVRWRSVLI